MLYIRGFIQKVLSYFSFTCKNTTREHSLCLLLLRCFLLQCVLEAAARCTSWLWTETASWTGEGTAAPVSVCADPSRVWRTKCIWKFSLTHARKCEHYSLLSTARSHSSTRTAKTNTHTVSHKNTTYTVGLYIHSSLHSLRCSACRGSPSPMTFCPESSRKIADELQMSITSINLYCVYILAWFTFLGGPVFSYNYLVHNCEVW